MSPIVRKIAKESGLSISQAYSAEFNKFALLIVKECAHIAEVNQAENMGWNIGEIIKEHFGVEQ